MMPIEGPIWLRTALTDSDLEGLATVGSTDDKPGARLALTDTVRHALDPVTVQIDGLVAGMSSVRVVAFDKTAQTNWALPWHQDRVIAVKARHAVAGYENWSQKQGVWHCTPPEAVLAQMLFVRVHLDDGDADTGAMEIAAGSHMAGVVDAEQAATIAQDYRQEVCEAQRGDILVLPMLTLHRSLAAPLPATRRVLRIDYAASPLAPPFAWAH